MFDIRSNSPLGPLRRTPAWTIVVLAASLAWATAATAAEDTTAVKNRLEQSVGYLASDKLEGRGVGTKGLDLAAEYLREQFEQLGLKTELWEGKPFQPFTVVTGSRLGKSNRLSLAGPPDKDGKPRKPIELKLKTDYSPLAIGGSGQFRLPLVFVGYGISGKAEKYDDYAGVDVKDKAVIIMRHEPQQNNPHSVFDGTEHSRHAPFRAKVSNAFQHGAAAVLFVTDDFEIEKRLKAIRARWEAAIDELTKAQAEWKKVENPSREQLEKHRKKVEGLAKQIQTYSQRVQAEYDPVMDYRRAGLNAEGRDIPVFHCSRAALDPVVKAALGKDLATLEKEIDKGPTPQSVELAGWQAVGQAQIDRDESETRNVVAVLEGEGPLADETIIIGAHYDHLGMGGPGSLAQGKKEVHNGADDNASGTAVLLEVARQLSQREKKLPRRVVFIAFSGEERGLLGSAHYVNNPLFPLEKTVAMLNMDMVGRLQENKLIVNGTGTAKQFTAWLDELNESIGFHLIKKPSGFGPSDHATFYAKKIPVIHFFTGSHKDYHKPSDDTEKLDVDGMVRIGDLVAGLAVKVAQSDARPAYQETKSTVVRRGGNRPYFGSIPDFASEKKGYALSGVAKDSPAEKAGIKGGDVVIQFGDSKIGNLEDIDSALRKYKPGVKVPIVVLRGDKKVKLEVVLDPPR